MPSQQVTPAGAAAHFDTLAKQWRDNLKDVERLIGDAIDAEGFAAIKQFGDSFLDQNRDFIARRAATAGSATATAICIASMSVSRRKEFRYSIASSSTRSCVVAIRLTEKTYGKMFDETARRISQGQGAILDAIFAQSRYRGRVIGVAARHHVPVYFVHCVASDRLTQNTFA